MAIRVSSDGPVGAPRIRRTAAMAHLAGFGLSGVRIAAIFPILGGGFVGWLQMTGLTEGDSLAVTAPVGHALFIAGALGVPVYTLTNRIAPRLLAANRHRVLFLRRFGFAQATSIVSVGTRRLGMDWRFVTLDDQRTVAVGAGGVIGGVSRVLRAAFWPFENFWKLAKYVFAPCVLLAYAVQAFWPKVKSFDTLTQTPLAVRVTYGIAIIGSALILVYVVAYVIVSPFYLMIDLSWDDPKDETRHMQVHDEQGLFQARGMALAAAQAVLGARLLIVAIDAPDDQLWRTAVQGLAKDSEVTLVDVSQPTCNVLWEIQHLTQTEPRPCVFVAERSRAEAIFIEAAGGPLADRLRELLDGRAVITYESGSRRSLPRFCRALRAGLEEAVTVHRVRTVTEGETIREMTAG